MLPPAAGRLQVDNSPVITVTKEDQFPGAAAEPGETITYTVVVTNESITDALGVTLSDTIDLHTTFVAGSLRASPLAAAYLPLVHAPAPAYPDLVVGGLAVSSDDVQVVIHNQGAAPVTGSFWVDLYVDPERPPSTRPGPSLATTAPCGAWLAVRYRCFRGRR